MLLADRKLDVVAQDHAYISVIFTSMGVVIKRDSDKRLSFPLIRQG